MVGVGAIGRVGVGGLIRVGFVGWVGGVVRMRVVGGGSRVGRVGGEAWKASVRWRGNPFMWHLEERSD